MRLFKLSVVLGFILFGSGCGLKEQGSQDAGYAGSGQQSGGIVMGRHRQLMPLAKA